MVTEINWHDELDAMFFRVIKEIPKKTKIELLQDVACKLNNIIQGEYSTFFVYNEWYVLYENVLEDKNLKKQLILTDMDKQILENKNTLYIDGEICEKNSSGHKTYLVPIMLKDNRPILLFLATNQDDPFNNIFIKMVKEKIEKLLNVVHYYYDELFELEYTRKLFNTVSRFSSITEKDTVFVEIFRFFNQYFPDFNITLHVSQDYDKSLDLPIKLIEYTEDEMLSLRTQSFLTGKTNHERKVSENITSVYIPLNGQQAIYGVVQIDMPIYLTIPDEDMNVIKIFSFEAAKSIEKDMLYQHSKSMVENLKLINRMNQKLNMNLEPTEILMIMREQIFSETGARQIGFVFEDDKTGGYEIMAGSAEYFQTHQGVDIVENMMKKIADTKEPVFNGQMSKKYSAIPFESMMAFPMTHLDRLYGITIILHEDSYAFEFESFKLVGSIIKHTTLALTNAVLRLKLRNAAITDYLTGLYGRNYLDDMIVEEMKTKNQGSFILFDIDDFKNVNDTLGHDIGDKVIIQVANIMVNNIRDIDVAARWGGEELAIYVPDYQLDDAYNLANMILQEVERLTEPQVTISGGVSTWSVHVKDSVKSLFIRADKALYEAKNSGKNCVVKEVFNPS